MRLLELYDSGRTRRFHNQADYSGAPGQTVAEHSWGVVLIVLELCRRAQVLPSAQLMEAALLHDAAERWVGDLPAPTKWRFPALAKILDEAEEEVSEEYGLKIELTNFEQRILKWADSLELYLYSARRVRDGAKIYRAPMDKIVNRIKTNYGPWDPGLDLLHELQRELEAETA